MHSKYFYKRGYNIFVGRAAWTSSRRRAGGAATGAGTGTEAPCSSGSPTSSWGQWIFIYNIYNIYNIYIGSPTRRPSSTGLTAPTTGAACCSRRWPSVPGMSASRETSCLKQLLSCLVKHFFYVRCELFRPYSDTLKYVYKCVQVSRTWHDTSWKRIK